MVCYLLCISGVLTVMFFGVMCSSVTICLGLLVGGFHPENV